MPVRAHGLQAHRANLGDQHLPDAAALSLWAVSRDSDQFVRVLLAGVGDEAIGGAVLVVSPRLDACAIYARLGAGVEHMAGFKAVTFQVGGIKRRPLIVPRGRGGGSG